MDTKKEDTDVKTAPEVPAMPAPGEPGPGPSAVPSEPLHEPVDVGEDSLEGLQSAFRGLSVEEVDTQPVKRKRESEKDAGDEADEGADQGQDPTNNPTFEGAPSGSGLHASPSHLTNTLLIPDPAAATFTPIPNPPMAEGTGFTGMPTYPAYGLGPPTTAFPEATTASEPVTSSSAPRWYAADYHHSLPATGAYVDAPGYATLRGLRRGPESLGGRSRVSGRSSNRSLTRSEINEVLQGATSKIVGDLTQEIREKLEPLMIPPQASPTTVGMSPQRVQANHLVAGLTNTLGSLRSRPMPTPAAIPRSPFVPRTAQPPYSHVTNSTRAELDRLGLTALRAMVDVEPYGSSDLGGDPSDDEPPSMTSASPSEDDDPEDPENPSGKKKKKKRKTRRPEGRRSQEAKAIATSKIVVNLPEFTGKDLSEFAENFGRFLRLTGQTHASGRVKCDLPLQCSKTKYLEKQVRQVVTNSATFADVLVALERQYPTYETDLSIRPEIQNLAVLPNNPKPRRVSELLYGSTSGDSGNRTSCCTSAPPAPAPPSGRPTWFRRPPWGKASETSSSTPSSTSPDTSAPHAQPQTARARPPRGAGSGCPPSTGGDTWSDTPCRGGWTPRAAPATTSPTWPTPHTAPPPTAPKSGSGKHG